VAKTWIKTRTMATAKSRAKTGGSRMKITVVGSRYFGAAALAVLLKEDVEILAVIVLNAEDRLAVAATKAGLPIVVQSDPHLVPAELIPDGTELIVTAHSHARITTEALAKARLGGIGYHPSLLPRHRGMAAVEWTVKEGDPIAGGTIYHLAERMDAGAIAMQDWVFVKKGESARDLWERALAPLGLDLMARVIRHAVEHATIPAKPQDEQFATKAPQKGL
jgi:methionyl-tRNA formyltransferase